LIIYILQNNKTGLMKAKNWL